MVYCLQNYLLRRSWNILLMKEYIHFSFMKISHFPSYLLDCLKSCNFESCWLAFFFFILCLCPGINLLCPFCSMPFLLFIDSISEVHPALSYCDWITAAMPSWAQPVSEPVFLIEFGIICVWKMLLCHIGSSISVGEVALWEQGLN